MRISEQAAVNHKLPGQTPSCDKLGGLRVPGKCCSELSHFLGWPATLNGQVNASSSLDSSPLSSEVPHAAAGAGSSLCVYQAEPADGWAAAGRNAAGGALRTFAGVLADAGHGGALALPGPPPRECLELPEVRATAAAAAAGRGGALGWLSTAASLAGGCGLAAAAGALGAAAEIRGGDSLSDST